MSRLKYDDARKLYVGWTISDEDGVDEGKWS
jgi:hypothetical protein